MSKRERVIALLMAKGCRELQSNSRKYRCFSTDKPDSFYWVGKCGALRVGRTITDSISLSM